VSGGKLCHFQVGAVKASVQLSIFLFIIVEPMKIFVRQSPLSLHCLKDYEESLSADLLWTWISVTNKLLLDNTTKILGFFYCSLTWPNLSA
jgi:hypothetical protein